MRENIIKKLEEYSKKHFMQTITICLILQISYLISILLFKQSIFALHLISFSSFLVSFVILKDFASEKERAKLKKLLPISITIFACAIINHGIISIAHGFSTATKANSFMKLNFLIDFFITIIVFANLKDEKVKEKITEVCETSVMEKLGCVSETRSLKPGDVVICKNEITGKPVVLPKNDRFLHMLILGPTGCGKTSQVITPMINQDMQNPDCGITVIEPKGDLAEKIFAMAKHYDRPVMYFNPTLPSCPYFNPLFGKEEDVIENMATTFKMLNPDSQQFFQDMNEQLIRHSLKVLKRLYGNEATLIDLASLVQNSGGQGRKMVTQFSRLNAPTQAIAKENTDTAQWFLNDYFNEKSKTYDNCSGVRSQISKIISNKFLRRVLNPPNGKNDIDFDKHLEEGGVIVMTTAQGTLRDLGRFLGYFIILQLQSAVFRRPGNEDNRKAHFLYIDEFQVYSNPGFADMLTQGRSYRVASHLATQNRALMAMGGGNDGKNFVELVSTNARNTIIFPGGNAADAKYYSEQFGEYVKRTTEKGYSKKRFGGTLFDGTVTTRTTEKAEANFSGSDLIYKKFGHLTYSLINNNSLQPAGPGIVEYIPPELNKKLNAMVQEYISSFNEENNEEENKVEKPIDVTDVSEVKDVLSVESKIGTNETSNNSLIDGNKSNSSKNSNEPKILAKKRDEVSLKDDLIEDDIDEADIIIDDDELELDDDVDLMDEFHCETRDKQGNILASDEEDEDEDEMF